MIRHKRKLDVPSWDKPVLSFIKLGLFTLSQFSNEIELTVGVWSFRKSELDWLIWKVFLVSFKYLPVYKPNTQEKEDAKLYAKNFRSLMSELVKLLQKNTGLSQGNHSIIF